MILTCFPGLSRRPIGIATIVAGCVLGFAAICSAQYSVLHTFPAPGPVRPYTPLVQANDGNFYGTTAFGGVSDQGSVFRMTPAGTVTIMHEFLGAPAGGQPYGSLVQASAYLDDENKVGLWKGAFDEAIEELRRDAVRRKWGAGPIAPRIRRT